MVKYFSVNWLAQSHHDTAPTRIQTQDQDPAGTDAAPTCRPHIPCVVPPRPPTFGSSYLQPKPKPSKPAEHTEPAETSPGSPSTSCASPISEFSGYSSGYESEAASCESPGLEEGRDGPQRRVRTKFTPDQISRLEKIFNKHKYLDASERTKTAQKLNLTETQVRTWFQNRRMKLKREVQDFFAPQVPSVMFQPLPPVQYQSPRYPAAPPAFYPLRVPQMILQQPPRVIIHNPHFY